GLDGMPRPVGRVVNAALAADPDGRPLDGGAWLAELRSARLGMERPLRARRVAVLSGVGLLAGLVLTGVATWRVWRRQLPVGRVTVAVADFANETRDPELDGLSDLLITSLQQSRALRVLTRSRLADLAREARNGPVDRIDELLAREIGRKADARALLVGSVRRIGDAYAVEVRALDPERDEYLFTLREQADGKAGVLPLVDRVSERTRRAFREEPGDVAATAIPVASVSTASLEAHRAYFEAERCQNMGQFGRCLEHLERAIALDPDFAMAHFLLAVDRVWSGAPMSEIRKPLAEALRLVDRAPPKDRARIRALDAQMSGRDAEAAVLFREAAAANPDDRFLQGEAGDFFQTRNEPDLALPFLRRAFELDATSSITATFLALALGDTGRMDELRELERQLAGMPARVPVLWSLMVARVTLGDAAGALTAGRQALAAASDVERPEAVRWLRHVQLLLDEPGLEAELRGDCSGSGVRDVYLAVWLSMHGRRAEALRVLEGDGAGCPPRGAHEAAERRETMLYARTMAVLLAGTGDAGRAWPYARRAVELNAFSASSVSSHIAYLGDARHAAALFASLDPTAPRRRLAEAVIRWRGGDPAGALPELAALHRQSAGSANPPSIPAAFLYGELLAEQGDDAAALKALRKFQSLFHPWPDHLAWTIPRSRVLVARSLDRLGRRDEAHREIEAFLASWKDADPGEPLLAEARALHARLDTGALRGK
ncbi:MAG TPA: CsgG/HfaB family protein, partial [Anaeromyxobacteraceae bacterium]|nr:CsgG/HfaB family protein [Anaeromyxobacteraceae bacterium]